MVSYISINFYYKSSRRYLMLDFRIKTFLAVCHSMNFTKAAKDLGLTQPAVSQHIHYLEAYYGVPLFHYEKKTLSLTDQGKILYTSMNAMANDEKRLQKQLIKNPDTYPLLSIGTTMTIGEYVIPGPLAQYIQDHPFLNLQVRYGNTKDLLDLLDQGKISLALIEGYYPKSIYGHKTYRQEEFICVAGRHFFKGKVPQRLEELFSYPLLLRERGSGTREILDRHLKSQGYSLKNFPHFIELENMHTLVQVLAKGAGLSFVYRLAVEEGLKKGLLQEIPLQDFSISHDFDFVWDQNSIYADQALTLARDLSRLG